MLNRTPCLLWQICSVHLSLVFICREMGERPGHRPWRGRHWNPAEPGNPAGTFLEVSYDCAPPDLHQVQPFPLTQRAAGGLWTQEHTAYTHPGNENPSCRMLFTQIGLFVVKPQYHIHTNASLSLYFGTLSTLKWFLVSQHNSVIIHLKCVFEDSFVRGVLLVPQSSYCSEIF